MRSRRDTPTHVPHTSFSLSLSRRKDAFFIYFNRVHTTDFEYHPWLRLAIVTWRAGDDGASESTRRRRATLCAADFTREEARLSRIVLERTYGAGPGRGGVLVLSEEHAWRGEPCAFQRACAAHRPGPDWRRPRRGALLRGRRRRRRRRDGARAGGGAAALRKVAIESRLGSAQPAHRVRLTLGQQCFLAIAVVAN